MAKTIVFKFGGASVKDAESIKNLAEILRNRLRNSTLLVISAMGKTTNALEKLLQLRLGNLDISSNYTILKNFHLEICQALFPSGHPVFSRVENLFVQLSHELEKPISPENYDEAYDRIICFGELISSRIVAEYLCEIGLIVVWQDARELIKTDSNFRFANVDWEKTRKKSKKMLEPVLEKFPVITQGFIGSDSGGKTTTLGREGSDFSAAILASCLDARSVTIWKDVPGVLNADPKLFPESVLFDELDYLQAAQMTFYGATVIHPKTIKPLANRKIPLFVRSFLKPDESGTKIHDTGAPNLLPTIILKQKQILVTFRVTDFTFLNESHIHVIYQQLDELKLQVNLLQTTAMGVSLVLDDQLFKLEKLILALKGSFTIRYNDGLELLTVLNPQLADLNLFTKDREVLLEQSSRHAFQIVRR
ncbi:aspartate kinase [Algoriphagus marincola]|uniref:Aspartokinase n=1 Tax=Algoriphagus marincola TaxID=264027 RepID=A0ABS7N6Z4_9BACT|nr:aspartate kinase [Algoriphagus marincola]MBY5952104.1 aspartate kinase [Algoriphagus marincola]